MGHVRPPGQFALAETPLEALALEVLGKTLWL
jgi:hypothetical protein